MTSPGSSVPALASDHLLLAGGGHSHALILRRWAMQPRLRPRGLITLVSRERTSIYSGMVPGVIAGRYRPEEALIDLASIADQAGVAFVQAEITGVDVSSQTVQMQGRPSLPFDYLSLNLGCITPPFTEAMPIKPLEPALQWLSDCDSEGLNPNATPFTVIGSGLAALEVVLALRCRWPHRPLQLQSRRGNQHPANSRQALAKAQIQLISGDQTCSGPRLNCTGSRAPLWLQSSGLPCCEATGRLLTHTSLKVLEHPNVLAAGDCAVIVDAPRPPSGVWAVRAAEPLARSLEALAADHSPPTWRPQPRALQLLGSGEVPQRAWAIWGPVRIGPQRWIWHWKERIDQAFMARLQPAGTMQNQQEPMLCRGCAAKLPAQPLQQALASAGLATLGTQPEDAQALGRDSAGAELLQSVDGFPALISDPWLNGRLTALHACSDLWACGADVRNAQAIITLPLAHHSLQGLLLSQTLAGIRSALEEQQATLIGGHTLETREATPAPLSLGIQVNLAIQGKVESQYIWHKRGMQPGDQLLLSRPLGTGVLFAASMSGQAPANAINKALQQMASSQHKLVDSLQEWQRNHPNSIHAATDITGFGLLGHLLEMMPTHGDIRIVLQAQQIPALPGALNLLEKGIASSLAPANRAAWSALDPQNGHLSKVNLQLDGIQEGSPHHLALLELLVDPQTCGPLLISCDNSTANHLLNEGQSWQCIGHVQHT